MISKLLFAATAAVAAAAAPPAGLPRVCTLYLDETATFLFGAIESTGSITKLLSLPANITAVMNGVDAGEGGNLFYVSPEVDGATNDGIMLTVDFTNKTGTTYYSEVRAVPGYPGPSGYTTMNLDPSRNQMIGALVGTVKEFFVIADVFPRNGTVSKVWADFSTEFKTWGYLKTGCSAYDFNAQVYYVIAGTGKQQNETVVGMPLSGKAFTYSIEDGYDFISLRYSAYYKGLVALARDFSTTPESMSYVRQEAGKWVRVFHYEAGVHYVGMAQTEIDAAGTTIVSALTDGNSIILSYVDLTTGKESYRVKIADPKVAVADIAICAVTA
jgi:hypothetical protein